MERISSNQQQVPIWDRPNKESGHRSSVDKAVQAHRDQVASRTDRTEDRLAAAREINDRFFPQPKSYDRFSTGAEVNKYDFKYVEEPTVSYDRTYNTEIPNNPIQSDDLYQQMDVTPVRAYAAEVAEKDTMEAAQEIQSDEVPKGTYVDYTV